MTALQTFEGIYRNGKVELTDVPYGVPEAAPVLVTFLATGRVSLRERGIDEAQAAELRACLATFAEDWDSPEMAIYDDYEAVQRNLFMAEIDTALRHILGLRR